GQQSLYVVHPLRDRLHTAPARFGEDSGGLPAVLRASPARATPQETRVDTNLPYPDPNRGTPMEVAKTPWYRRGLTQIAAVAAAVLAYPIVKIVIAVLAANVLG